MSLPSDHLIRLERARRSLDGLSVGDAFGERFFVPLDAFHRLVTERALPAPPWRYTDDTAMALSIFDILRTRGRIVEDELATLFARRYARDPHRGYGPGAHDLLADLHAGAPWRHAAPAMFKGTGSFGNGGAMRVAPVGAYFADDAARAAGEARKSACVTHAHPEGQAGAIAIAVAAVWAWQQRDAVEPDIDALFELVLEHTPASAVRDGIVRATEIPTSVAVRRAADELGNGSRVSAMDTVPFCLWAIARHPRNYEEAMWATVAALGDRDTTCAIVGGVVALSAPAETLPTAWLEARETLPGASAAD